MIGARTVPALAPFVAGLAAKAKALGEARAAAISLGRSPMRWRNSRLLWPLFGDR